MNELFEKIATEVFFDESTNGEGQKMYTFGDEKMQKFAERIVQECAGLFPNVYVEIENEYGHTPVIAADYIKKHFGVEE